MRHAFDKVITYGAAVVIVATVIVPWTWREWRQCRAREARWQETTA